jgi:hypothetical protein
MAARMCKKPSGFRDTVDVATGKQGNSHGLHGSLQL